MKTTQYIPLAVLALALLGLPRQATAEEKKVEAAKPYPLTTCLVTDEKLDSKPYSIVYEGQEIKFCCKSCLKKFQKDPAAYLKKLNDAQKKPAAATTNQTAAASCSMDHSEH